MKINLENGIERNFYGINEQYAKELTEKEMTIEYDDINGLYTVYDKNGVDQERLTSDELQTR